MLGDETLSFRVVLDFVAMTVPFVQIYKVYHRAGTRRSEKSGRRTEGRGLPACGGKLSPESFVLSPVVFLCGHGKSLTLICPRRVVSALRCAGRPRFVEAHRLLPSAHRTSSPLDSRRPWPRKAGTAVPRTSLFRPQETGGTLRARPLQNPPPRERFRRDPVVAEPPWCGRRNMARYPQSADFVDNVSARRGEMGGR